MASQPSQRTRDATSFDLALACTIRPALETDLAKLEWGGQFTHFREIFKRTFLEQQHVLSGPGQAVGRCRAARARTDNDHIVFHLPGWMRVNRLQ